MAARRIRRRKRVAFFGHFGAGNFGNESTLQSILHNLRHLMPDTDFACVCTGPEEVAADHKISTIKISGVLIRPWRSRNPMAIVVRKVFVGIPVEMYRWFNGFVCLRKTDVFIVPGTGLLTDAYSLVGWGPYSTFKWSVIAKLCRCKLLFVSVGAGPLYSRLGKGLVKTALSLADFRSYRDKSTVEYLKEIGFEAGGDQIYPDLVFSLSDLPQVSNRDGCKTRQVVGIGLMEYAGRYSVDKPRSAVYSAYLETLASVVGWLLSNSYDIRLLIGDVCDKRAKDEFKLLLRRQLIQYDEERIIDEEPRSVQDLTWQLARTDLVVATRFHNVVLALLLNKPVISIAFHHKCTSLMASMGLSEYCQDINELSGERLIEQFKQLKGNGRSVNQRIREKVDECRESLNEQYEKLLSGVLSG